MNTSRRDFLRTGSMLGLGLLAMPGVALSAMQGKHKVRLTRAMIGTLVSITVIDSSRQKAQDGIEQAFAEVERLSAIFDRHQSQTAVSVLNSQGRLNSAPQELMQVLSQAKRVHSLSGGAFDMTVQPVVDLLRSCANPTGLQQVDKQDLKQAMQLVGTEHVQMQTNKVAFGRKDMGLTLDGIGKGFIVDKASELLSSLGLDNHLINAGGDIRTSTSAGMGRIWTIAIEDPAKKGNYPDTIQMGRGAVATSGGYEVYFDRQASRHHIISPGSGLSPHQIVSASVAAPTVMEADALATSTLVLAPRQSKELINSLPGREFMLLACSGRKIASPKWGV